MDIEEDSLICTQGVITLGQFCCGSGFPCFAESIDIERCETENSCDCGDDDDDDDGDLLGSICEKVKNSTLVEEKTKEMQSCCPQCADKTSNMINCYKKDCGVKDEDSNKEGSSAGKEGSKDGGSAAARAGPALSVGFAFAWLIAT